MIQIISISASIIMLYITPLQFKQSLPSGKRWEITLESLLAGYSHFYYMCACVFGQPFSQLVARSVGQFAGHLVRQAVTWLVGQFAGHLVGWSDKQSLGRLVSLLVTWSDKQSLGRLVSH
jgi:hypothetical protein